MELERESMIGLNMRLWLGREMLRWIREENSADPRAPDAIARLEQQVETIKAEIVRRRRTQRGFSGEPEPVVVGLQTLKLMARRH